MEKGVSWRAKFRFDDLTLLIIWSYVADIAMITKCLNLNFLFQIFLSSVYVCTSYISNLSVFKHAIWFISLCLMPPFKWNQVQCKITKYDRAFLPLFHQITLFTDSDEMFISRIRESFMFLQIKKGTLIIPYFKIPYFLQSCPPFAPPASML